MISVIVPVYNVEAYVDKCIESIVNQTYRDLEIILVDDGSPDHCGDICDEWAKRDSRIRVIHKKNGGLSDARNAGMAIASGDYIGFVDSDDYIAPEMYQLLLERMNADGSDIAACGVKMVFEDGTPDQMLTPSGDYVLGHMQALEAIVRESLLLQPVWYKLYKTDLVRGILFAVGKYHEDVFWSWQAIDCAQKVSIIDAPCYFYLQRSGSIMAEKFSEKRLDAIEAQCIRQDYLAMHYPELAQADLCGLHFSCLYFGQQALRTLSKDESAYTIERLKGVVAYRPIPNSVLKGRRLTHRLWLRMTRHNFVWACRLRNFLKIGL